MDTYFPKFHSNKTCMVEQVTGMTCVVHERQEDALSYTNCFGL